MLDMTRVDDDMFALHLEVALSSAAPSLLDRLADSDWRRRHAAIGELARQLVERLRCFDIRSEEAIRCDDVQPTLFSIQRQTSGLADRHMNGLDKLDK